MQSVHVCQIVDVTSEKIFHEFMAPNVKFAEKQFKAFLTNPKWSDSIDPSDFTLVMSFPVEVYGSYQEYINDIDNSKASFVAYGHDVMLEE